MSRLVVKRVYAPPQADDGWRVLVDRLWPRGLSKEAAQIDLWAKEIAPSDALRHWFGHEPDKWDEFRRRYAEELIQPAQAAALQQLRHSFAGHAQVSLLYAAHDQAFNNAVALLDYLQTQQS